MNDERVQRVAEKMLEAIAGLSVAEGNAALVSALGVACGGIAQINGQEIEDALDMVEAIAIDAKATVRKHWGEFEAEPLRV